MGNTNPNLELFEKYKTVPDKAKKQIKGGRLNGMTDINPVWRIQSLTEEFGPCGIGWKYTIEKQWLETGADGVVSAFCNILLYFKKDGQWSEGVPGTGGSAFVAKEKSGPYTSDECYKMALTDAISVACKSLGFAADIYFSNTTESKYAAAGDDPTFHNIMAIKRRVEGAITRRIQDGMSKAEIYKALGVSGAQFEKVMGYFETLARFEQKINQL